MFWVIYKGDIYKRKIYWSKRYCQAKMSDIQKRWTPTRLEQLSTSNHNNAGEKFPAATPVRTPRRGTCFDTLQYNYVVITML